MPIIRKFKVPIAPLKIQEKIVAEIKVEQKIVDQNKKLIEIFEKKIKDGVEEIWGK